MEDLKKKLALSFSLTEYQIDKLHGWINRNYTPKANPLDGVVINFLGDNEKVYVCKLKILGFPFATFDKDKADAWVAEDAEERYENLLHNSIVRGNNG